ncbi:uncharacterized protein LOC107360808 isoform X4 [Tetranychus urticae]|uniref:uncharacterized protein LOC107360808 isoform X4 n=1 Tax=Tetranychus urticae TaxID=32264 RepID=UPI000D64D2C8|nr:uncharacterized protein LOC107360808 isoform X4 [Tetranychus urticae]
MLINELPDDCLLTIFYHLKDLQDLINCYKVCEKWCNLIVGRTKRVKYLINQSYYTPDCVSSYVNPPIDVTCLSKLFPNLRIAELSFPLHKKVPIEDIVKLVRETESLKGIIYDKYLYFKLKLEKANLEMLSTRCFDKKLNGIYENVKQFHLYDCNLGLFECIAHCFPNLERLHISKLADLPEDYFEAPVWAKLKIVEINLHLNSWVGACCSFVFMDRCPALQSAHIKIECCEIIFDGSIKLANLQDLVLQFYNPIGWDDLQRLMSKFPNLKHLALRNTYLSDDHIKQLILILPKLTLLDIRESPGVTQDASNHVRNYCKRYGRSIKFYFKADDKQIEADWPQLLNRPDKICRGFDFMEHCFFKSFDNLPLFLDPIDD